MAVRGDSPSVGETLLRDVRASAANASGFAAIDRVLLGADAPQFVGATDVDAADRWIFGGNRNAVREVIVDGERVVDAGRHRDHDGVAARYREAMETLLAAIG